MKPGMGIDRLIARLPTLSLGRLLGVALGLAGLPLHRIVRRNLAFAYPDLPAAERRRRSWRVFQNYGMNLVDFFQMRFMRPEEVARRMRLVGGEHVLAALRQRRGLIVVSGHLGSWEFGMQAFPCVLGETLTGVAKRFKSGIVEKYINTTRTRFGNEILYKKDSLAEMTRILREGGVLAAMVDMARSKDGVDIRFFGKKATATPAVAMLALRCRTPVVPMFCVREPDGALRVYAEPALEMRRTRDLRADLVENTQRLTDTVERMVRRHPEQWFWLMKRWKDHYPHLYE
jgi:KDO2-lipid IV(A) lauroyltransferase